MLLYKTRTLSRKSIYECDRCKKKLKDGIDPIYTLYVRKDLKKSPKKKWDLCERCYVAFYRAIKKGVNKNIKKEE